MRIKTFCRLASAVLLLPLFRVVPAQAQGDRVLAQVADGISGDTQYITKLRITNLGPEQSTEIKKLKVMFFLQNGTPWVIATNLGTGSEIQLDIGSFQTLALDTTGQASLSTGYAIVRNTDATTIYAEDFEVAVTAFYEVRKGGGILDTISVPVSQPTVSFVHPVEINTAANLYTAFAIVNLSNVSNGVTLKLYQSTTPSSGAAPSAGTQQITLSPGEQRNVYLNTVFTSASTFKGMLQGVSQYPVAILALLQSPTPGSGFQFATMVPAYIDSLRRNTYMYLRLGAPLDADLPISDYFENADDSVPWDLLFEKLSDTTRQLTPKSGAQFAVLGLKADVDFDNLTIENIQALSFTSNPIDLSNTSANLARTFAFAIKTGLGRYVKVRIADVINRDPDRDLALEVFIFK